jgi:hypothetical protein
MNVDDAQTVFFKRHLEEIDGQLYDVKYAKLEALELVSPKPLNPGAESYTYRSYDRRGVAKMTANYAGDSPRVDVAGAENTAFVKPIRDSFAYNVQEIRAATMVGLPLDAMRAMAARRAINEKLNAVALTGDSEFGLVGLFNQSNPNVYSIPNGAVGASPKWSTKTGDEVAADIFGVIDLIPNATKEVENGKRLLMPYKALRYISARRMSSTTAATNGNDSTILQYVKVQRPQIEIRGALLLDTAGSGGAGRMMCYDPDRVNLEWLLPIPFESFPPQLRGLEYVVECHARCGGVIVRYPLTISYADGFMDSSGNL